MENDERDKKTRQEEGGGKAKGKGQGEREKRVRNGRGVHRCQCQIHGSASRRASNGGTGTIHTGETAGFAERSIVESCTRLQSYRTW